MWGAVLYGFFFFLLIEIFSLECLSVFTGLWDVEVL